MSPQTLNQSKKESVKEASNWSSDLSKSSKVCRLCSFQIHHIKHNETKFQMLDECFPNQFHQPKRKSATDLERTHGIPKVLKTELHKRWAFPQWSNKWSNVSPQKRHMMHQSTKSKPLLRKLSPVRILSQATIQTKKETRLDALTF